MNTPSVSFTRMQDGTKVDSLESFVPLVRKAVHDQPMSLQ